MTDEEQLDQLDQIEEEKPKAAELAAMGEWDFPKEEEPEEDPHEAEDPPAEDPSEVEDSSAEEPEKPEKEEPPSEDGPPKEDPPKEEETDEQREARLRAEIEASVASKYGEPEKPPGESKPEAAKPTDDAFDSEKDLDFLGDAELDSLLEDKAALNSLLNKVYKAGLGAATRMGSEKVLRSIPEIVKTNVETQISLQRARDVFFETNKDLAPYPMVVAESFGKVASENPDLSMDKLLEKTEETARERLNLHRKVMVENSPTSNKPRFEKPPGSRRGGRRSSGELKGMARELNEMMNIED